MGKEVPAAARVTLPWGFSVKVRTNEHIGNDIFNYGIFDRIVPEAIYRLCDAGELAVEIGANIGQNCSLLAARTGPTGRVIAFEPHPEIFEELSFNAALWPEKIRKIIQLENVALGEANGEAWLANGAEFHFNRGCASLVSSNPEENGRRNYKVAVRKLDDFISSPAKVGVCKIDVEGHELSVLKGMQEVLSRKAVRDIIFEDFESMPSPVVEFLWKYGFTVFQLNTSWWKPFLTKISQGLKPQKGFTYNYLATLDPQRAQNRFDSGGWRCLICARPYRD